MKAIKYLIILLLIFICQDSLAQITIDGTVTDADLSPVSDALVEIIDENDSTNVYSANTNEQGYFKISSITDIETNLSQVPQNYIVLSNYPNPFNPSTAIYFELPKAENIEIVIYDILGREVRALYKAFHEAGSDQIIWDGRNNRNSPVAAGIYLCRLKTKDMFKVHKMVLLDGGSSSFLVSNISNKRRLKSNFLKSSNIYSIFNFRLRVTGNDILETEFKYLTCSKDTTVNLKVPSILQSATIGSEGGKLETEGFSLTIPEGAFSDNTLLNLALNTNLYESFSTATTKVYRIDGIPSIYLKPLNVRIKCISSPEDSVFIALGIKSIDPTTGNDEVSFNLYRAEDSSGFLVATLPASNSGTSLSLLKSTDFLPLKGKLFLGLSGGVLEESEHFAFFSRELKYISLSYSIVESAEKAFNDFCDIIKLDKAEFWNKYKKNLAGNKIDIYTYESLKSDNVRPHRYCTYLLPDKEITLFNLRLLIEIDDSKVSQSNLDYLLRDLYHYIYFLFPLNQYTDNYESTNQFWLHHAIAAWSEELYSSDNFVAPLDFDLHYKMSFNGIQSFLETSPSFLESYGIGMSALIKYLTKVYGNNIIGKFFNGLKTNPNALEVILDTLNYGYDTPESTWWPDFFKEYISGNIYNVQGEKFLSNITKTIDFNDGDTLNYIDETYNDLSTKLFRININSKDIKDNKSLNFKLGPSSLNLDYVKALVFGISGNNLTFLSEGIEFSVGNLSQYDGLLACVVNSGNESPYTGTSNINLDIRVKNELPFNSCTISVRVNGIFEQHTTYTTPSIDTVLWSAKWYTKGNFTGYTYEGIINTELQGGGQGTIELTLDDNLNIVSFDVKATHDQGTNKSDWSCSGASISPTYQTTDYVQYFIYKQNVCNKLTNVYAYYEDIDWNSKMTGYFCDDNSSLEIILSKL